MLSLKRAHADVTENNTPHKRKRENDLYKPPTVEELNNIKETENLYNNNLFRLQIQELVSEINIKNKRRKSVSAWLESFQTFLDDLPEYDILLSGIKKIKKRNATKEEKLGCKLASYEQVVKTDQDVSIKLVKPDFFEKFGLYDNNCLPGPNLVLNINLKIPKKCFLVKDFLNNRYLCKRYYYLLYIAEHLKSSNLASGIAIDFHDGNYLLPIVTLECSTCNKTKVNIFASPSDGTFKLTRFLPDKNNLKTDLFNLSIDNEVLKNTPTVLYNSSLAYDITLSINNDFIKECLKEHSNVQEGIKLLCVWLKQRELNIGSGSFSEDLIIYFVVYLLSKKKINKYMSSYQVTRTFWNFIGTVDLQNEPVSIANTSTEVLTNFKKHFDLVCLDKSGCYNVAAFLNLQVYKKIRAECQLALKYLDSNRSNSFHQLFLTHYPFYLQYDLVIDLTKSLPLDGQFNIQDKEKIIFAGYLNLLVFNYVFKTIQRALSKRVLHFVPRLEIENDGSIKNLLFGANLNPEESFSIIELGPALNDHAAAAEFRQFWGNLSSDRRFRDGSTNVAVHFKTNTIKAKRSIVKKILDYILGEKLDMKFKMYYDEFEGVLVSKRLVPPYPSGTNEETILKIIHASDNLGKKLRSLPTSLKITGIHGASDVYNFTEVFPPIPTNFKVAHGVTVVRENNLIFPEKKLGIIPRYVQPIKCILHVEHSSKWPNDVEALRHIKTLFYLEILQYLQNDHHILCRVTTNFIDILFEGLVFRYELYVPKELALMKKVATESGLTCFRESFESTQMETSLNIVPKVVSALKGIQSSNPSYGLGTCLIKRWLRSQLIDDFHFPDIALSLVNASLYLNEVFGQSNTPQIAFLRFLKFFSEFDWELQPVVVNFNDEMTNEELTELEGKLQKNRNSYPDLYIIMPYDQGSSFTKNSPTKEVLHRIKCLARESLNFIDTIITGKNRVGIKEIFIPNFDGYNVLIYLKPLLNPRKHEQIVMSNVENRVVVDKYEPSEDDRIPIVDFNPVEKYLMALRENYGKYALFFHDSYGGNTIGVLWKPKVFEVVDFKVARINAGKLVGGKIVFNIDAVIEDFYILGKDLVKTIESR